MNTPNSLQHLVTNPLDLTNQIAIDVIVDELKSKDEEVLLPILMRIIYKEMAMYDFRALDQAEAHIITRKIMVAVFKEMGKYGDTYHEMIEELLYQLKDYQAREVPLLIESTLERLAYSEVELEDIKDLDLDEKEYLIEDITHYSNTVRDIVRAYFSQYL